MQGEYPTICLIEEEVDRGIQYCLKSLVGRLDLVKMDLNKVKALVLDKWALSGECLVTPLGKGYLMFKFDKEEDYAKVWEQGSWLFDSQVLRLSKWTPNFTTEKETHSHAMVWVVSESEGGNQTQAREELGTESEVETAVGITLESNLEVLGRTQHSPQGNRFQALVEAEKILESGNWGEQMEKEEEQVRNKKGYKPMWRSKVCPYPTFY
ncbi:hypothetical protein IFM89_008497 [Coptis chinensis]|uniref:DUF4283 domain-containing protein n=1 Tax=Coptis chinensis TaxID=261450 RepID=A0A835LGQ2_9MAGN|nr:hypothetical protein IFM89_008497 [Coptis chinensis]